MTLVRMLAFRPQGPVTGQQASLPAAAPRAAAQAPGAPAAAAAPVSGAAPAAGPVAALATLTPESWPTVSQQLELAGLARQLASNCAYLGRQGGLLRFALDPRHQAIRSRAQEEKLSQALSRHFGEALRVDIEVAMPAAETPALAQARHTDERLGVARAALDADPAVLALKERFGATLHPDSVRLTRPEGLNPAEEK
jgi:DNA polymerase-3 subunit gamma/tau